MDGATIAALSEVPERGSVLFTATDAHGDPEELILVPCDEPPGVHAWANTCTHESQRFDTGDGASMRDGELVCPRHGSLFDACSGDCDNGPAAGTELPEIEVAVEDGDVVLTDPDYTYLHGGGIEDGDGGPSSTSHIGF